MTANKPEVKKYTPESGYDSVMRKTNWMREEECGLYVSLSDYEAMQADCENLRKELKESEDRGSALSANACHGGYGDEYGRHRCNYQNKIDHLIALLRHSYPIIKAHANASHMLEGFRPKRNQWDDLAEAIDAAIQEASP